MIDDGRLLFAFGIETKRATKVNVRVLTQSVWDLVFAVPHKDRQMDFEIVLKSLLPTQRVSLPGTTVARFFNCDADHIGHLLHEGSLPEMGNRSYERATPRISCQSVAEFLRKRRLQ